MSIQTPLAKVKFLGSAHNGTDHFIKQRLTAIFMIPLMMWFVITVVAFLSVSPYELPWLVTSPFSIIGAVLFVINFLIHAKLGLAMIIEDYVKCKVLQPTLLIINQAICYISMVSGVIALSSIYILSRVA